MEGYDHEVLTIRTAEAESRKFSLEFVRWTDVGGSESMTRTAVLTDEGLLLERAHDFIGAEFAALALEHEGQQMVLVPFPTPGAVLDSGAARAVFRRHRE